MIAASPDLNSGRDAIEVRVLVKDLSKNFTVLDDPGPGVAKLTVALTDASGTILVLRTISIIVPQAHA